MPLVGAGRWLLEAFHWNAFARLLYPAVTTTFLTATSTAAPGPRHRSPCRRNVKEPAWNVMGDKFQAGAT
ncbi:hypothetical protein NtRootA9_06460 [Arthrobacter sp. NtRootA9]|nr:hypothetical protein NtRootA9_06460 [Arthrobacter sp. NtRootA9]